MRTIVYIDGFNLYYAQLKGRPHKWLDVKALSRALLHPKHNITCIKYFTARVSGAVDRGDPRKQQIYLEALKTIPEVEIHFGSFLSKNIWRPLINLPIGNASITTRDGLVTLPTGDLPVAGRRPSVLPVGVYPTGTTQRGRSMPARNAVIAEVHTMEEKGSDVNLASHLVNDACCNHFDQALVISNDTDLITPIKMAVSKGKTVILGCPSSDGASFKLKKAATYVRHIRSSMIRASQFPDTINQRGLTKPAGW